LGFVDSSEDGNVPPPEYGSSEDGAPDAPPMDDGDGPPEAPPMDMPTNNTPLTSLGDILRQEGKVAHLRKDQLSKAPQKQDNQEAMQNELLAAIARRREALQKVPEVEKKKDPEQKTELQNTILRGIANLRKVEKRRDSMDKNKGSKPERVHIPGASQPKWKPVQSSGSNKMDDVDLSGFGFRCVACKGAITNMECVDTPNGLFHQEHFICQSCTKGLLGDYLTVNGFYFHPDCLNCMKCLNSLIEQPLLCTQEGKLYCSKDAPRDLCAGCGERIEEGRVIPVGDKNWHEKCFVCAECSEPLAGKMYVTHQDRYLCKSCYQKLHAIKCSRCQNEADGPCFKVNAPDGSQLTFHQKCYTCRKCAVSLRGKGAYAYQGDVYCKPHYDAVNIA